MIYNLKLNKPKSTSQCITCAFFDAKTKICNGFGKICFEMDAKTKTILDPKTKQPLSAEVVQNLIKGESYGSDN